MEIVKKGNTYFRELDNPESLKFKMACADFSNTS